MKILLIFLAVLFLLLMAGCADTVDPGSNAEHTLVQIPGCVAKIPASDSCFSYTFEVNLKVDFCVSGNCCPDHDRFVLSEEVISDTINVAVTDTARSLCRCICNYIIHSEFRELPLNSYLFNVHRLDSSGMYLLYSERVFRVNK